MKTITVAELRQNPTSALEEVEGGETYVVTRHRRPVARLVPVDVQPVQLTPRRSEEPAHLADRPRKGLHTFEETESLLAEMASDW